MKRQQARDYREFADGTKTTLTETGEEAKRRGEWSSRVRGGGAQRVFSGS